MLLVVLAAPAAARDPVTLVARGPGRLRRLGTIRRSPFNGVSYAAGNRMLRQLAAQMYADAARSCGA